MFIGVLAILDPTCPDDLYRWVQSCVECSHVRQSGRLGIVTTYPTEPILGFHYYCVCLRVYIQTVPDGVYAVDVAQRKLVQDGSHHVKMGKIKERWQFDTERFGKESEHLCQYLFGEFEIVGYLRFTRDVGARQVQLGETLEVTVLQLV